MSTAVMVVGIGSIVLVIGAVFHPLAGAGVLVAGLALAAVLHR